MQKLVTIPLDDDNEDDMVVREHLREYLEKGWQVVNMVPVGAGVGTCDEETGAYVAGWLAVLLEKVQLEKVQLEKVQLEKVQ